MIYINILAKVRQRCASASLDTRIQMIYRSVTLLFGAAVGAPRRDSRYLETSIFIPAERVSDLAAICQAACKRFFRSSRTFATSGTPGFACSGRECERRVRFLRCAREVSSAACVRYVAPINRPRSDRVPRQTSVFIAASGTQWDAVACPRFLHVYLRAVVLSMDTRKQ